YQVLRVSLYLIPLFIAILYIFGIELSLDSFNSYFLIFIVILNGLLWAYNQELK
ncbi:PTS mannitol transporter subunit IIABC, partial [Campylobacter jejuni]|nr:PTS mannitol transporter subunit IIABC [Campylobacter jejuni]